MSETTNLKLFKHDEVIEENSVNFDIRKSLNENWDKVDDFVAESNNKVIEIKENIDTLNKKQEEIRNLENIIPQGQATGESITLNDSADYRFKSFEVNGNSKQESREGYNLLPNNGVSTTIDGVTFTVNSDRSVTMNGTATANANFPIFGKGWDVTDEQIALDGTYLTIGKGTNNAIIYCRDAINNINVETQLNNVKATNELKVITYVYIQVQSGKTLSNEVIYPMIVNGEYTVNTFPKYEQYGASPSKEYPSEVKSCGDNVNLFDKENANIVNGYFDDTNKQIVSNATCRTLGIKVEPNTTYTVSKIASTRLSLRLSDNELKIDATFVTSNKIDDATDNASEATITTLEDTKYLFVWYFFNNKDYTEQEILDSIKVEKSTKATPYSPYGQGCINEVICNKNLLKFNDKENNGITYTKSKITIKNPTNYLYSSTNFSEINKINNKVTISLKINGKISAETVSVILSTNIDNYRFSTVLNAGTYTDKIYTKTIDLSSEELTNLRVQPNGTANCDLEIDVQIEEGSVATDYVEHAEQLITIPTQQPMRAVGDVRDCFIKKDGKRYERHNIIEFVLNGTENVTYYDAPNQASSNNSETIYFSIPAANIKFVASDVNLEAFCNMFKNAGSANNIWNPLNANLESFFAYADSIRLRIKKSRLSGYSDDLTATEKATLLKNYLKTLYDNGIPIKVYAIRRDVLDLLCTEEQNSRLDELEKAQSYKNVTHIYSTNEVSPIANVTYYKDLETIFATKEEA